MKSQKHKTNPLNLSETLINYKTALYYNCCVNSYTSAARSICTITYVQV